MKKFLSMTLALLCLCLAVPAAQAAGGTYVFPKFNMSIDAPKGWYVLTQDVKEGDPALKALELTGRADYFAGQLKENGIYLDMINKNDYTQIALVMQNTGGSNIDDFNDLDDNFLLQVASQMQTYANYLGQQITIKDSSVYKHKQAKFAIINFTAMINGTTGYGCMYITIKNGQGIAVMMASRSKISKSLKQTLKSVVDSIVFKRFPVFPANPATYELNNLNMKVDSPGGWYVSTQDVKDDDPNLDLMAMDKTELADYYKQNGIYFYLIDSGLDTSIYVNMKDCSSDPEYVDFNLLTDGGLLKAVSETQKEDTLPDPAVYVHKQTKFIVSYTEDGIRYQTQINGQAISVILTLKKGETTDSLKQTLKSVVDSIVFKKVTSSAEALKPAAYELPELNMTVDSREGWYAFSRNVDKENPDLIYLGMNSKELADQYIENDIYLNMVSEDFNHIFIGMRETGESRDIYDLGFSTNNPQFYWGD